MQKIIEILKGIVELPLLKRELIEASRQKRTYVLRATMACVVGFIVVIFFLENQPRPGRSILRILGSGRELALVTLITNLVAIYAVTPLMCCGTISSERERQTLGLLLVSKLGPARLVIEKLLSGLMPTITFLVVTLPVLAIAYLLGGLQTSDVILLFLIALMAAIQAATAAILCSSLFNSAIVSFFATYGLLAFME
ncbi:MAG: hypothetical protein KDA96_06300, partial [Planctomycetaceae bacterium]|nr:hypothetical protein [Planctomycetaceae bacterium]